MIHEVLSKPGRYAPLGHDHPGVGMVCPGCWEKLIVGDNVALVDGMVEDPEDEEKAALGLAHTVSALIAHESCAYPNGG